MNDKNILNNRYQLISPLGRGGMSVVYHARDLMLERDVAIKILRKDYSGDPQFRERFRLEAKAAANLSHPNIVMVHDFGLDEERLFIVMEYVPGTDLKNLIKQQGKFGIKTAINLISQACSGIGYAHRAGLVHCDVKPQNMLITPDQRLKVADFGIARALSTISPDERVEVVWGSPLYFSPEQAAGGAPSPASDVYSLGVILYEMLAGVLPFNAHTPQELAQMHREVQPESPRTYNPNIPVSLEQIILKVLSKEPSARYRTADQLGRVLISSIQQPLQKPKPTTLRPAKPPITPESPATRTKPPATSYQPIEKQKQIQSLPPSTYTPLNRQTRDIPDFDWVTWLLALVALIAGGGLIPFWLWVMVTLQRLAPPT